MAATALRKRSKGNSCATSCIVSLIGSVLIPAIGAVIVFFVLTPRMFGLQDFAIGGATLEELGLADKNLYSIISDIGGLLTVPDEATIVTNPYVEEEEQLEAEDIFGGSTASSSDGQGTTTIDYDALLGDDPIIYDNKYLKTLKDTTFAFLGNKLVGTATDSIDPNSNAPIAKPSAVIQPPAIRAADEPESGLAAFDFEIKEVSLTQEQGIFKLRTVAKLDISSIAGEVNAAIPPPMNMFMTVPNIVYAVSYMSINADENGVLTYEHISLKINDLDAISNILFAVASDMIGGGDSGEPDRDFNGYIGDMYSKVFKNLGSIGTGEVDEHGVIVGEPTLGAAGIFAGKITYITHTA